MSVTFNPDTGIVVENAETVRSNIANLWKNAFKIDETTPELNTEPETPAGQLIDGMTALVLQKDNAILFLSDMFNPETSVGVFQDALGKIYFIDRHVAQPTTVSCTCKGLQGTQIPVGSIVQDGNGNQFTSTELATIGSNGSVDVLFQCTETGAIIVNANTVNKIITVIPGWDSVINNSAGVVGRDRETQAEFEQRRYDSVAKNSHGLAESVGGSINALENVIACRIEQNRTNETVEFLGVQIPGHSVYLSVYGGTSDEIGEVMHNKLDPGCGTAGNNEVEVTDPTTGSVATYFYTVPTAQNLYILITTDGNATYDEDTIKQAIINNFNGNTNEFNRVIMGDTVYSSRFYQDIINAGLNNLVQVQVSRTAGSGWSTSVNFNLNEMPVLSESNISFTET